MECSLLYIYIYKRIAIPDESNKGVGGVAKTVPFVLTVENVRVILSLGRHMEPEKAPTPLCNVTVLLSTDRQAVGGLIATVNT